MLALLLTACLNGPRPEGIAATVQTGGPRVIWDIEARPLPEIPLPNDAATRLDPSTATGRRVNVSEQASTSHEAAVRRQFNRMDGFSTYLPITVRFDAPLDVADLQARHADHDFRNDAALLLNVDPRCQRFGEEISLEMGRGELPVTVFGHADRVDDPAAPDGYRVDMGGNTLFPFDAHGLDNQRLFQESNEDDDGDGALDPGEDEDGDGVLDVANLDDPGACDGLAIGGLEYDRCVADHLLTFYERETNTLILKPLWPMEQRCTHAVVLTNRLKGEGGAAVVSPFPAVNPRDQTGPLAPLAELLPRYDLGLDDVSFAWTFTTGSMTADLESLRAGLYGHGPFARLADEFPVSSLRLWTRAEMASAFFDQPPWPGKEEDTWLDGACAGEALARLWSESLGEWGPNLCAVEADLSAAALFFGGSFRAPDLMVDKDGLATERYDHTMDEVWELDAQTGEAAYGETEVTFWCSLPYEDPEAACEPGNPSGQPFCAPFPTVLYSHGYGGSRAEISLHMGRHNAMGFAACSLDAYGHGLNRWLQDPTAALAIASQLPRFSEVGVPELGGLMTIGRDRDLNNDGLPDPGMDQWTSDIFHTRDNVRQSSLEIMQLVRILRHMDGVTRAADGSLLGDVNGDGVVDWGGPTNTIAHWGISLGGILSGVVSGAEPSLTATSPNAGGAGLTDVTVRSSQAGVPEAVILPMLGPLFGGCLPTDGHDNPVPVGAPGSDCLGGWGVADNGWTGGTLRILAFAQDEARFTPREVARVEGVVPGDRVRLRNLDNGEEAWATVNPRGWLRLSVAADALDPIERRAVLGVPDDDTDGFDVTDPALVADRLELTVFAGDSDTAREVVRTFELATTFQGSRYAAGAPLVALQRGYGFGRQTPDFRRLLGFAQAALGPGDPAIWGAASFMEPLDVSAYDPYARGGDTHVLMMPTAGDNNVPVHTGIAMARVSGLLGSWRREPELFGPEVGWRELHAPIARFGMSADDWMIAHYVQEGDARLQRFPEYTDNPNVIWDADDVGDGLTAFSCGPSDWSALIGENRCPPEIAGQEVFFDVPSPEAGQALRLDRQRADGTFDAFRVPLLRPAGQHGIYNAQSFRRFDNDAFMVDFTVRFLGTGGGSVAHAPGCDCSASDVGHFELDGAARYPAQGRECTAGDMKVCDPTCAAAWGLRTPGGVSCVP